MHPPSFPAPSVRLAVREHGVARGRARLRAGVHLGGALLGVRVSRSARVRVRGGADALGLGAGLDQDPGPGT